jgi:hypothetical protein
MAQMADDQAHAGKKMVNYEQKLLATGKYFSNKIW